MADGRLIDSVEVNAGVEVEHPRHVPVDELAGLQVVMPDVLCLIAISNN